MLYITNRQRQFWML